MKLSNPLKYAIATLLAGTLILFLVIYVEQKTIAVGNENTPLLALVEHIKNKSKSAHIWFEKAMRRDKNTVFEKDMYASLDSTVQLFNKVLEGGETELGVFHKSTNLEINNTLKQLLLNSEDLKQLAEQRMLLIMKSASNKRKGKGAKKIVVAKGEEVGGALDQAFDASYEKLQGNYEGLATLVKMKIVQDNGVLNDLFWVSVFLIIVVFGFFSFLLYKISNNERLAGNALMVSEKRFRTIFEEAPLGIALIDPVTGIIHEINPKYSEIIGRSKEEMNNVDWMTITHPDDILEGVAQKALMSEHKLKSFKMSKRYIHSDGSTVWGDVSIASIETGDKSQHLQLCMVEDITEQKRIEDALKISENELRGMFACMDDLIFELSDEGVYLKIAPTNPSLLFKPADTLLGKRLNEIFPKKEAEWFISKILQTLKEKKNINMEYTLPIDDKEITFEATISPLTEKSVLCIARDITARKHAEEEIIKSQVNFENAQKLAKIGSWEFNLLTSELVWSKELYRIFELEGHPAEGLYESYRNKFHPDDLILLDNATHDAIQNKLGYNFEHRILDNGKNIIYLSCIGEVIKNDEGKLIALKGTCQDITTRKKMENLLKETEQNALLVRHAAQVPGIVYQYQIYPDGSFVFPFVSEGVMDLCELSAEEVMQDGAKLFNCVHPDDIEGLMLSINESLKTLNNWKYEYRVNLPKKGTRWIKGNSKPEKLSDGSTLWHGYLIDITESKEAKEALQISKDKQEAVFNGSNDAIMLLTRKGFFDCNPKTLEMFGLADRKEFIESHPSDSSPAFQPDGQESLTKSNAMIEIAFEKGVNRFEWVHQRKNGEKFPAEVLLSAFNYGNERVLQATVHDITERKLVEKRLLEFKHFFNNSADFACIANTNGYFETVNQNFEKVLGYSEKELLENQFLSFVHPDDIDSTLSEIAKLKTGSLTTQFVNRYRKKDGSYLWFSWNTTPNSDTGKLYAIARDITYQKRAEEKIKSSEEKYRSVVENAADMIITFDSNYTIQFINHLRPGSPTDQVIGKSIFNLIPHEYQERVKQKIKKVFEDKLPQSYELPGQHLDGSSAWYSTNLGPVFSGDEVSGITLIIRDISDSKKAEEKIQQSLKEKEILLQEVHHRVKNNLQIILSILNLQHAQITDKKTLDLVRDIRSRIKAMSFIHELLYQTDDFSSINFSDYITNITNNLIYSYTQNQTIDLKLDVGAIFLDLDSAIPCGLIINEIVTNALKYAFTEQENGEVSVSLTQKNDFIQLTISDNGKGLPSNIDFRNTESLGMQLVVTLVQQLGGEIVLDNSNGAKYTITFKMINKAESGSTNNKTLEIENA
ncbi:MAG: PAS domain S-box protein [Bacteroidia bacterium]|nr:PAS domain S-box protein [Bacteroidia bacterium]